MTTVFAAAQELCDFAETPNVADKEDTEGCGRMLMCHQRTGSTLAPDEESAVSDELFGDFDLDDGEDSRSEFSAPPGLSPQGLEGEVAAAAVAVSEGSLLHASGECKPCAWFWKAEGCSNGERCLHCHLCPPGAIKERKKLKKAEMQLAAEKSKVALEAEQVKASLSLGSAMHGSGLCRPCAWFWKPTGCENGQDCLHCHLCPSDAIKDKKKSKKAAQPLLQMQLVQQQTAMIQHQQRQLVQMQMQMEMQRQQMHFVAMSQASFLQSTLPSKGSALHCTGSCKPCAWFWKEQGCQNGADCDYCHFCGPEELKVRKKVKETLLRRGISVAKAPFATRG